jgi:hypothetical protein
MCLMRGSSASATIPTAKAIEVIAVEGSKEALIVIHAMALRKKYTDQYEEAKRWRL